MPRNMKVIGFFNSTQSWGGGEKWHFEAALYFLNSNYTVHFFLTKNSELHQKLENQDGIHIHFIKISGFSFLNPLKVLHLKNIFKNSGIEVLLINLSHDLKIAANAATMAHVEKIIYTRGIAFSIKNTFLNRYIFSHWVTDILANSNATAKTILENNERLFPKEKIKVIYNHLHVAEFVNRPFSQIYTREKDEIIIGCVGRLEKEKNHIFFIRLSEALNRAGITHKILIGGIGSMEDKLKQLTVNKQLSGNFIFCGFVSNVKDLLMSCDIFMLPSLWEGFGFVIAEAFLCRKPVIAFNTTAVPELVKDGQTGFLTNVDSVEPCVEKIILLKSNPIMAKEMGDAGYDFVSENFEENKIMNELEHFIIS
ncbi:MAG TPA: glycosyltransferase [Hanamia sp.]